MIVRETYRPITHTVCFDHWSGVRPLPDDAPSLGPIMDARGDDCEYCGDVKETQFKAPKGDSKA